MSERRIIVIDDSRLPYFDDDRAQIDLVKTSLGAIEVLKVARDLHAEPTELWLDYTLLPGDDIFPVLQFLLAEAKAGTPYPVERIYAHTSSASGRDLIRKVLGDYYDVTDADLPMLEDAKAGLR